MESVTWKVSQRLFRGNSMHRVWPQEHTQQAALQADKLNCMAQVLELKTITTS